MGVNSLPRKRMRPVNENMSVLSGREVSGFREVGLVRSAEPDIAFGGVRGGRGARSCPRSSYHQAEVGQ